MHCWRPRGHASYLRPRHPDEIRQMTVDIIVVMASVDSR
jgi:hypothetical protein